MVGKLSKAEFSSYILLHRSFFCESKIFIISHSFCSHIYVFNASTYYDESEKKLFLGQPNLFQPRHSRFNLNPFSLIAWHAESPICDLYYVAYVVDDNYAKMMLY